MKGYHFQGVTRLVNLLLILIMLPCFPQPNWVKTLAQSSKEITVHKDASAILLHNVGEAKFSKSGKVKTHYQKAYKILSSDGEQFGAISLPTSPFLEIKKLKGWAIHPDGSVQELSKSDIAKVGLQESTGYYDDAFTIVAVLPNVETGVLVAFEWMAIEEGWTSLYQNFLFQVQQPVLYARYSVEIPDQWQLWKAEWFKDEIQHDQQNNTYTWTARDLAYQPEEPLSPSWYYLSQRIAVSCYNPAKTGTKNFSDWPAVSNWFANLYTEPAIPNTSVISEAAKLTAGLPTFEEKLKAIAMFSQRDIRYVAVEIGKERWQPRSADVTLHNRYGDCKDKTTLMRAMLQAAEIPSVPVLASVNYPVDPRLPTPFQFDHCIIAVPMEDAPPENFKNAVVDGWLFFDPTDPATPIGELPWGLQGSRVLLGADKDTTLYRLPYPAAKDFRRIYTADAILGKNGALTADVKITDFGSAAGYLRYLNRSTTIKEQIEDWRSFMAETLPGVTLRNFQTVEERDSIWTTFTIESQRAVQKVGGYYLLRPDIFNKPESPKLTADERHHPIWFGGPRQTETRVKWQFPENWIAEVETGKMESECKAASVYCQISISENTLTVYSRQQQNGKLLKPEDYVEAKAFCETISKISNQAALFKEVSRQ